MLSDELHSPESVQCARCQIRKPADSFSWRRKTLGQRDTFCRPCRAAYQHDHYVRNRQRYLDNAGSRRRVVAAERMSYLLDFFATHHCVDCGEGDASVLEFDHLGDKSFTISHGFRDRPWHEVLAEIEKCEVRCANCHKRRTAESQGWFRARLFEDGFNRAIDPRV